MLNCFIDYIGIRYSGAYDSSPSGVYINALPGLTLESIDKLADENEQRSYRGVWQEVQQTAVARFYLDILSELNKCFALASSIDYEELICSDANMALLTNAWKYLLGVCLMDERLYTSRLNRFTTVDREQAQELQVKFEKEYQIFLAQAVKLLDVSDYKMQCGGNPQTVPWLP